MKGDDSVFVYIVKFDKSVEVREVQPAIRNEAIQRCGDTLTKQQRYCAWRLLDYALVQRFGKGVADYDFTVGANGQWRCNGAHFSLTHCNNIVCVAVCNQPVGVDVEAVANFAKYVDDCKFAERTLTHDEIACIQTVAPEVRAQALAETWTQKESLFKLAGGRTFVPSSIDTTRCKSHSQLFRFDGTDYALAVATADEFPIEMQLVADIRF